MVRRETDKKTNDLGLDKLWPDMWKRMSGASERKEEQKWAIEKPKLEHARRLRRISFIDPDDEEFKNIMKNARWPCKIQREKYKETCRVGIARQNTLALLRPMNLRGSAWKDLLTKIMKTTLQLKA